MLAPNRPSVFRTVSLVSLCCLLVLSGARAQPASVPSGENGDSPFVEATVVAAEGESRHGQVEWAPNAPTPETLRFRTASAGSDTTYSPSALQSVRLADGRRLVSRAVTVDQVPTDPHEASSFLQSGQARERPDTLFLEVIAAGPLNMYAKLGSRNHYYVEQENDIAELLNRRQYVASQNAVATRRRYRKQLQRRMEACPEAQDKAGRVRFRLQEMKKLVARYNRCVGTPDGFERADRPRFSTSVGVVGGATRNEFALSSRFTTFNSFGWGTGGELGASITARLRRTNGHWAFHTELVGRIQRIEANAGRAGSFLGNSTLSASDFVEMRWVTSVLLMRYYLNGTNDWSPYAEAGLTAGYLLSMESQMPDEYAGLDDFVLKQNRFTPGVAAGAGLQYRAVQIGARAELTSAWMSYSNFKSRLVNVSLLLGYQF